MRDGFKRVAINRITFCHILYRKSLYYKVYAEVQKNDLIERYRIKMEESEHYVYVEFNGVLDNEILKSQPVTFKMIGIDTEKPTLQIANQVFIGEYRDTVGTAVFLEEDDTLQPQDPVFTKLPAKNLRYVGKTRKNLFMTRVFAKEHVEDSDKNTNESEMNTDETTVLEQNENNGCSNVSQNSGTSKTSECSASGSK